MTLSDCELRMTNVFKERGHMKLEDMKLTVTDESGNQVICDVLLTFGWRSDQANKMING